jgi:hypothetical protein
MLVSMIALTNDVRAGIGGEGIEAGLPNEISRLASAYELLSLVRTAMRAMQGAP